MKLRIIFAIVLVCFSVYATGLDKLLLNEQQQIECVDSDADESEKDTGEKDTEEKEPSVYTSITEYLLFSAIIVPKRSFVLRACSFCPSYLLDVVSPPPEA